MRVNLEGDSLNIDLMATAQGNRSCGGCQLCCKLVPVKSLAKGAGERCRHQKVGKGCTIYANRPEECRDWSCRWLAEADETSMLTRPDRSHYVIDQFPDRITAIDGDTGKGLICAVVQIWMDPAFPKARHDPALKAYMLRMAEWPRRMASLIRWNSKDALLIAPPPLTRDHDWMEFPHTSLQNQGDMDRINKALGIIA